MTARLYLTVYAKDNLPTETAHVVSKSLGTVDAALSDLQFRDELHGTGGIVARINRHHPQAALFVEDRYVLAHSDFGVIGGAFLREGTIDLSSDDGPGGEFMVWTGPGPMAILSNAVMDYDSNIFGGHNPIDGYWDLSAQGALAGNDNGHPIPMLKRALVEAQLQTPNAISVVDHSSWSYALDSAAAVPPTWTGSYGVNVGDDLLTIVGQFDQLGGVFFRMSHFFKLDAYLSYGTAKSGAFGAGTVRFEKGVNVSAAIDRKVRGSVHVTHLIVGGADRTFTTAVDPTYVLGQVIRYGFLSVPETSDTSSLQEAGLAHIAARKRQTDAWTFPLHDHGNTPASGIYEPGNHYKVGDTVSLHTGTGEYDANEQAAPVAAIEWRLKTGREANDDYWVIPEIGSTFHWGGTGSFQGRDAPGSQHRFLLCEPAITATTTTLYDLNWEGGAGVAETVAVYPSGTGSWPGSAVQVESGSPFDPALDGSGYVSYNGTTGGDHGSPTLPATPGATYDWSGYAYTSISSPDNFALFQVRFFNAADVELTVENVYLHQIANNNTWQPWAASVTAPANTAYMRFGGNPTFSLGDWHYDKIRVTVAGSGVGGDGHPDLVGTGTRATRCDHKHHVLRTVAPTVNDDTNDGYPTTTLWTNTATGRTYVLTDATVGAAVWVEVGTASHPSLAAHDTLGLATQAELDAHAATAHGGLTNPPWLIDANAAPYSAVPDNVTDATAAITTAIADAITAAVADGGRVAVVELDPGIYKISGALDTTGNRYAQVVLPTIATTAPNVALIIRSKHHQSGVLPNWQSSTALTSDVILHSTLTGQVHSATHGLPSMIGSHTLLKSTTYNNLQVHLQGISFRQGPNPSVACFDFSLLRQAIIEDARFDTTDTISGGITAPTNVTGMVGLMPTNANNGVADYRGLVSAFGYYAGIPIGEHTRAEKVVAYRCRVGLNIQQLYHHGAEVQHAIIEHCPYSIGSVDPATGIGPPLDSPVSGADMAVLTIGMLDLEDANDASWAMPTFHVNDASNLMRGVIRYTRVQAVTGTLTGPLTVSGATNLLRVDLTNPDYGGGVGSDHGALTGLGDDDHPQYLTPAEHTAIAHKRWVPMTIDPTNTGAWELLFTDAGDVIMSEVQD